MSEHKYVTTKIDSGDYLLPSDDATTVWRIARDDEPDIGSKPVWSVWRYVGSTFVGELRVADLDWSRWECVAQCEPTRDAAIKEAMRLK